MATNDFIGFASSGAANVMSQADYAAAHEQFVGVQPGMASSAMANKVWRQGANMAAALGEMIKAQGIDALDNGDIATLSNNIVSALSAFLLPRSGGTMTGTIESTVDTILKKSTTTGSLIVLSGNSSKSDAGANIVLRGGEHASNPGEFTIHAGNGNSYKQLIGKPDGTLTWDGNSVVTVETGTWTPTVYGSTTEGAATITSNTSYYQKFGNLIFLRVNFRFTITSSPAGEVRIGGLPYAADFFYQGQGGTNANPCQFFNLSDNGFIRTQVYTSSGLDVATTWGATTTSTAWANGVGENDLVLGSIWYRTTE